MREATYDEEDFDPRRRPAFEDDWDDEPAREPLWRRLILRNPLDTAAAALMGFVAAGIAVNALARQNGPHPAPLFATAVIQPAAAAAAPAASAQPADVETTASATPRLGEPAAQAAVQPQARPRSEIIADIQRELMRRRLYDGAVDGLTGPKTEAAIRRYETQAGLRQTGEASEALLSHLRRPARRGQAAGPAARPERPQTITQLLERERRPQPAARPAATPRPEGPRSIADLIAAESSRPPQRQR